jgi:hypothetical protein
LPTEVQRAQYGRFASHLRCRERHGRQASEARDALTEVIGLLEPDVDADVEVEFIEL